MANYHHVRINDTIKHLAMQYMSRESNRTSLVTVTSVDLYDHDSRATIMITVLPEDKEKIALEFAKRHRAELREFIKENARLRVIPFLDFEIDHGEKNRQRIDEITIKDPNAKRYSNGSEEENKIDPLA
ncbi:MAG: ribosome-binding factor A [Patescibacteria group bacterium]